MTSENLQPGDVVVLEEQGCKLCRTGITHLAGAEGQVEGPNEFWQEVHSFNFPGHRVFSVRLGDTRAIAPACEFALRRIVRASITTPAERALTES